MKKIFYCLYVLWAILSISSLFWCGNLWLATSFVWLPCAMCVCMGVLAFLIGDIIAIREARKKGKNPPSCSNCIFGKATDLVNSTKKEGEPEVCLGEKHEGIKRGSVCQYYMSE